MNPKWINLSEAFSVIVIPDVSGTCPTVTPSTPCNAVMVMERNGRYMWSWNTTAMSRAYIVLCKDNEVAPKDGYMDACGSF